MVQTCNRLVLGPQAIALSCPAIYYAIKTLNDYLNVLHLLWTDLLLLVQVVVLFLLLLMMELLESEVPRLQLL